MSQRDVARRLLTKRVYTLRRCVDKQRKALPRDGRRYNKHEAECHDTRSDSEKPVNPEA